MKLTGKRVLVTGASSGIGRETALLVGRLGAHVLLLARRAEELATVRDEIERAGGRADYYPCDLNDFEQIDDVADKIIAEHGGVDVLVNNAGRSIRRSVELSLDRFHDYDRSMRLNYFAPLRLTLKLLPGMLERREGKIVNVTSQAVQVNSPRFSAYTASKSALEAFGRCTNREFGDKGVTVVSVRMPLVRTPMITPSKGAYRGLPSWSATRAAKMVLKGINTGADYVNGPGGTILSLVDVVLPGLQRFGLRRYYDRYPETAPEAKQTS
ncbi:SDR family NAD(P)-dependent oxidoreductase [Pseudonocardiaceae bacterium YIM PH 21723]|nr:SDR family NAD(P)-dependent oxidoreductase [Pseudonocardiaceae bacterium YIM PH 21723]